MKKIFILIIMATVLIIFAGCKNETETTNDGKIAQFEEIDKISSEVAEFHTYTIKKYLKEIYSKEDIFDQKTAEKIVDFIEKEMFNYNFNYLKINNINHSFFKTFDYFTIEKLISFGNIGYDLLKLELNPPNVKSSELNDHIANLNTLLIQTKCNNIEENILPLIEQSETFEEFQQNYLNYVKKELSNVQTIDEYQLIRIFADVFLSSIECWVEFFITNNSKSWWGDAWNTVKETASDIWHEIKPYCKADAAGAIVGAGIGVWVDGIGAGPGAVVGGCSGSMCAIIEDIL